MFSREKRSNDEKIGGKCSQTLSEHVASSEAVHFHLKSTATSQIMRKTPIFVSSITSDQCLSEKQLHFWEFVSEDFGKACKRRIRCRHRRSDEAEGESDNNSDRSRGSKQNAGKMIEKRPCGVTSCLVELSAHRMQRRLVGI